MRHTLTSLIATVAMLAAPYAAVAHAGHAHADLLDVQEPTVELVSTYMSDTQLTVGSATLIVKAGSMYESVNVADGALTVVVPAGEAFDIRYPAPANNLENDALLATCNVLPDRSNRLMLYASTLGARTFTVTPGTIPCSTTNASTNDDPTMLFSKPGAGETLASGQSYQIFWQTNGSQVPAVKLRMSLDGGNTWPVAVSAGEVLNNGVMNWTVPEVTSSANARLRVDGYNGGRVVAFALSPTFAYEGLPPEEPSEEPVLIVEPYDYEPAEETSSAATIGIDKGLSSAPEGTMTCVPETRIKAVGFDTLYYCGKDGKRYVFPNRKTHDTWYGSFVGVVEWSMEDIAKVPIGGNVTYRPGVRMVKIQSANEVFAVAENGTLRHVVTEAAAARLYGPNWNQMIDDIPDAFFVNYSIGSPIYE